MAITISGDVPNFSTATITTGTVTTLTSTTISDGTNSTSMTNAVSGSAKAWVNYNGSSKTVLASYNVSSVTYNSTGNYTLNFTNAVADANYACLASANFTTGVAWAAAPSSAGTKTTTQLQVQIVNNGSIADLSQISIAILR